MHTQEIKNGMMLEEFSLLGSSNSINEGQTFTTLGPREVSSHMNNRVEYIIRLKDQS